MKYELFMFKTERVVVSWRSCAKASKPRFPTVLSGNKFVK